MRRLYRDGYIVLDDKTRTAKFLYENVQEWKGRLWRVSLAFGNKRNRRFGASSQSSQRKGYIEDTLTGQNQKVNYDFIEE